MKYLKQPAAGYFLLGISILLLIGYHMFGYIGHYGYDDIEYARLAHRLNTGTLDPLNHFSHRIAIVGATAVMYRLFGIGDLASALPTLLITIAILWLVYRTLRAHGPIVIAAGLSLTLLSNWFIFYADKLMPDIYVCLAVLGSVLAIYKGRSATSAKEIRICALLFTSFVTFGFLAKESIVLALPLYGWFFLNDILHKRHRRFWAGAALYSLAATLSYFTATHFLTGSALSRLHALDVNAYLHSCSYDQQPLAILWRRISREWIENMAGAGMLTAYLFILPSLFFRKGCKHQTEPGNRNFFNTAAIILFLSANFMTVSPTSYSPMCVDPRHFLFVIPVASIAGALALREFLYEHQGRVLIPLFAAAVAWWHYSHESRSFDDLYLPLFVLTSAYSLVRPNAFRRWIFVLAFGFILGIIPYRILPYARQIDYATIKNVNKEWLTHSNPQWYVISDQVSNHTGPYHDGFRQMNYHRLNFESFDFDTLKQIPKVVIEVPYYRQLSGMPPDYRPNCIRWGEAYHQLLYSHDHTGIKIWMLNDSVNLSGKGDTLVHDPLNPDAHSQKHWNLNPNAFTGPSTPRAGTSEKINEYSATFEIAVDSLKIQEYDLISISLNVLVRAAAPVEAVLVISLENNGENNRWEPRPVQKFIAAYDHWWPAQHPLEISVPDIVPGSVLKAYIYNPSLQEIYAGEYSVRIEGVKILMQP